MPLLISVLRRHEVTAFSNSRKYNLIIICGAREKYSHATEGKLIMLEQVKRGVDKLRCDLTWNDTVTLRRPFVVKGVECAVRFALGLLLSGAKVFGSYAPFGAAVTASSGGGIEGAASLLGVLAGYFAFTPLESAVKYAAMSVLIFAVAFAFRGTRVHEEEWAMPLTAAFLAACVGMIYAARGGWSLFVTVMYITETVLIGGGAYFFRLALAPWGKVRPRGDAQELRHTVSVLLLAACGLMTLQRLQIAGVISVGRTAAAFIILVAAYRGGMAAGAETGVALGLSMDIAAGGAPFFSMLYALSGLVSGVFHKQGRLLFVLGFIAADAVAVLWTWSYLPNLGALYETFIATVVFLLIPLKKLAAWGSFFFASGGGDGLAGTRLYMAARLERASLAFRELYETMKKTFETGENDNDIGTVFDNAADKVCRSCKRSADCWSSDYMTTANAVNDAVPKMLERGKLEKDDFPAYFVNTCLKPEQLVMAVNDELKTTLYRRQYRARLRENQAILYGQYRELSTVLKGVSDELGCEISGSPAIEKKLKKHLASLDIDAQVSVFRDKRGRLHAELKSSRLSSLTEDEKWLDRLSAAAGARLCEDRTENTANGRMVLMEAEPLAASVGVSSIRKKGERVSGDNGAYFKTEEGVLCVILSDGCGTGPNAARESENALKILQGFLRSGIDPETALKILNSVMLVRNEDGTLFTTVDLLCLDLFSGEARIFKYGAAPSYIKRGAEISRIDCDTLAAGLSVDGMKEPDCSRFLLNEGSFVIIASDGVATAIDDTWLREAAAEYPGDSARELSMKLLDEAVKKYGKDDDMTVLSILLEKRA